MLEQIKKDLPNFPEEVITLWLLPYAEKLGWPPSEHERWNNILADKLLSVWQKTVWEKRTVDLSEIPRSRRCNEKVRGMFEAFVLGRENDYSRGLGEEGKNKFISLLKLILETGVFPEPPILYEDGQQYHQYMFCDLFGCDLNYIRRIPFGTKGQDKWAYQALLDKHETPNDPQMMLEAGQMKSKKEKYFKTEVEKVIRVLEVWKDDPKKSKKGLGVVPWKKDDSNDDPLTEQELASMKRFLKKYDVVDI